MTSCMKVCWLLSLMTSASACAALPRPPPPGPPIIGSIMSFRSPAGCLRRRRTRASAAGPGGFYSINGGFRVRGQVRPTIQVVAGRLEVEHQRRVALGFQDADQVLRLQDRQRVVWGKSVSVRVD